LVVGSAEALPFRAGTFTTVVSCLVFFPYLFDFQMRPTRVWIRRYYSERTKTAWLFVTRQENAAA
jgi:hypothetical protein